MAWWLERKTGQRRGLNGQGPNDNVPTEYATNKKMPNDATTNHRLNHKKPPPNEPPSPKQQPACHPRIVVRLYPQPTQTANRKPPTCQTKPGNRDAQRKTPETPDGTTHPLRRAYTTHRERPKQTTHLLRQTHQAKTRQTNNHINHTPTSAEAETRHAKNTPRTKPSNGNTRHEAAGAPNEPRTRFGGYLHCTIPHPMRFETNTNVRSRPDPGSARHRTKYGTTHLLQRVCGNTWCLLPPCPLTTVPEGPALKHLQLMRPWAKHLVPSRKIMPETGWAAV
ncbi:hypothetical protein BS47DRAFT_1365895 [Hydnum rufescens UP504]|uniref:Uncharacterized protein n=1 Tax=Hydnum rufescens UP504 TaxID=1448309 RepID=A0A9P6APD5_9AGAM|nr:hypothetical protein BS47DRAFT_1365895 [Hydnum rufescens UP504]